ncbi:uncharacterized protein [Eurosta solidaginis]|uniref:uncharacterized protein n=1 Tax=Eurosta solidaginis TaxID=178769 RepID=UPI00353155FF
MEIVKKDTRANSRVCRVCLLENDELFSIFQETHSSGLTIAFIISECTRYPVIPDEKELPSKICYDCMDTARMAYDFKQRVEKAYMSLMGWADEKKYSYDTNIEFAAPSSKLGERREYGTQTDKLCLHPCELCELKFFDLIELRQHRKQIHNSNTLQCRICGMRFKRIRQLRSHMVHNHPSAGIALELQCTICRKQFGRREHLNRHLRCVHRQPEKPSGKKSLKEPEIELINQTFKNELGIAKKEQETVVGKLASPEENNLTENQFDTDKTSIEVSKPTFTATSLFFECGQDDPQDIECEANMDINPITSDDEAFHDIEVSGDILPRLKLENEQPNIKVECEADESGDGFDIGNMSPDWEQSKSPPSTNNVKEERESNVVSTTASTNIYVAEEPTYEVTEKRRIADKLDEFLAENSAVDKTADSENRCTKCQRTFSRHCHLRRHMLSHVEEKAFACNFCAKRFTRSDHLKKHVINLHHAKEFKCEHCNAAFAREVDLTKHIEHRHGTDPQSLKVHDCEYCAKKFTSRTYLRKHILLHTDRIFACKLCDDTFKERKALREHEKGHHSERRNFLCSICGESFVRNDYLRIHMRRHNGEKPYKCQFCGKGFPRATDVKIHERYHTGTKPNLCTLCGKGFHRAYNLTIHMRTHTGERPYKCEECGRGFTQSNDLKAHIRRHTGERFKCTECDAGFLQMYALRQHALAAHGINMEPATGRLQKFAPLGVTSGPAIETNNLLLGEHLHLLQQQHQQILQQQQNQQQQTQILISSPPMPPPAPAPSSA